MKREVLFYKTADGHCPVEAFLDALPSKTAQKALWVVRLVRELDFIPSRYFKKLSGTKDIWECRIVIYGNIYRLFGFFHKEGLLILTHGIVKKTQKTPREAIRKAEEYKADWLRRR